MSIKYSKEDCGYHYQDEDGCLMHWQKSCDDCKYYGQCPNCDGTGKRYTANIGIYIGECSMCNGTGKYLKAGEGK